MTRVRFHSPLGFLAPLLPRLFALSMLVVSLSAGSLAAFQGQFQEDRNLPVPTKEDVRSFNAMIAKSGGEVTNQNAFDAVLNQKLAAFSWKENFELAPKMRIELKRYMQSAGSSETKASHGRMRKRTLEEMTKMCGARYHPFVRVNAMLLLIDLNAQEAPASNREPPVPDPEALKVILKELGTPQQLDAVKTVALLGVERHAQLGIASEADKQLAIKLSADLAKAGNHEWIRRRAVIALGSLRTIGKDQEIARSLLDIIANQKESLGLRCEAARAFGSLDFKAAPKMKYDACTRQMVQLAVETIEKLKRPNWTPKNLSALQTYLSQIEIGLKGLPDPNIKPGENPANAPPFTGMLFGMGPEDPQRKLLTDLIDNRYNLLLKAAFSNKEGAEKDINYEGEQLEKWLTDHPPAEGAVVQSPKKE